MQRSNVDDPSINCPEQVCFFLQQPPNQLNEQHQRLRKSYKQTPSRSEKLGRVRFMNKKAVLAISLFLLIGGLSCICTANAKVTGTFRFRAWIDGSDYVYIQNAGGKVWYEHLQYDYPGEHSQTGVPYNATFPAPTTIDGVDWTPTWDKTAQKSNTYTSSSHNYPSGEWTALAINKITNASDALQSRGPITIVDHPSSSNGYTAKVLLNDDTGSIVYRGAAWYEFEISWEAPDPSPGIPFVTIAAVAAVLVAVGALLFFLLRRRRPGEPTTHGGGGEPTSPESSHGGGEPTSPEAKR